MDKEKLIKWIEDNYEYIPFELSEYKFSDMENLDENSKKDIQAMNIIIGLLGVKFFVNGNIEALGCAKRFLEVSAMTFSNIKKGSYYSEKSIGV